MKVVRGKLKSAEPAVFDGYRVDASFQVQLDATGEWLSGLKPNGDGDRDGVHDDASAEHAAVGRTRASKLLDPSKPTTRRIALSAEVAADGTFELELPFAKHKARAEFRAFSPTGYLVGRATLPAGAKAVEIDVALPPTLQLATAQATSASPPTFRGVLVSANGAPVAGLPLLILAREAGEGGDVPVGSTRTDASGWFRVPYPQGSWSSATVRVATTPPAIADVPLVDGAFPERATISVDLPDGALVEPAVEADAECSCEIEVPRLPDLQDLISSPEKFSIDLDAGQCVSFNVPNRTLEEFSFYALVRTSEPATHHFAPPPHRKAITPARATGSFTLALPLLGLGLPPGRQELTAQSPVDWDVYPTLHEAVTVATGHLLHYKQVWQADGYSLGDLVYSLPLAPCQKKRIAVVEWGRQTTGARAESTEAEERLEAMLGRDRDVTEIVSSALQESARGRSSTSTWGVGAGGGAAGSGNSGGWSLGAVIGISGGGGGAESSAWNEASRQLAASTLQQLRDRTQQAASLVRSQRSSVIQTVQEGESVRATTEVVANHNHCHAVTLQYFQVLRHLVVRQQLAEVRDCLFVPLLMSKFDIDKVRRWRDPLHAALLNRSHEAGFDALDRVATEWEDSNLPAQEYADEPMDHVDGELRLTIRIARPRDPNAREAEDPGAYLRVAWAFLGPLGVIFSAPQAHSQIQAAQDRDRYFREEFAPQIARAFVSKLRFKYVLDAGEQDVDLEATLVSDYVEGAPLYVRLRPRSGRPPLPRKDVRAINVYTNLQLPEHSQVVIRSAFMRYRTAHLEHALVREAVVDDDLFPSGSTLLFAPMDAEERRNPKRSDRRAARVLVEHLNDHVEYYHKCIWWSMDPDRRYMLLDGFIAPNGQSVASVVENRLMAIVGNSMVFPVAPGIDLDRPHVVNGAEQDGRLSPDERARRLFDHYRPQTPASPMRITVPTHGVHAEAVMGSCNSCERKEEDRFWRFGEAPCEMEPTPIADVTTESRRGEQQNLQPTPLPAPVVSIQNAPAAPDPSGLAAALQVIGTPNVFRDLSGLDQNQRNAIAAFQSSLQTALEFGREASKLTQQQAQLSANSANTQRNLENIRQARNQGLITNEQARSLTESELRSGTGNRPSASDLGEIRRAQRDGLITNSRASELADRRLTRMVDADPPSTPLADRPAMQSLIRRAEPAQGIEITEGADSIRVTARSIPSSRPSAGTAMGEGRPQPDDGAALPEVPSGAGLVPGPHLDDGSQLPDALDPALAARIDELGSVQPPLDRWIVTLERRLAPANQAAGQALLFSIVKLARRLFGRALQPERILEVARRLAGGHGLNVYGVADVPGAESPLLISILDYDAIETLRVQTGESYADTATADLDRVELYFFLQQALADAVDRWAAVSQHFPPRQLTRSNLTANAIRGLIVAPDSRRSFIATMMQMTGPEMAPFERLFRSHRTGAGERRDRELPNGVFAAIRPEQYALLILPVAGVQRQLSDRLAQQRAEQGRQLDASLLRRPQEVEVDDPVEFVAMTTRGDTTCEITLGGGPVHVRGGDVVLNAAGDRLFILEGHLGGVTFQNETTGRFYTQTAAGLQDELTTATFRRVGQLTAPIPAFTGDLIAAVKALFPEVGAPILAAHLLRYAGVLATNYRPLEQDVATLRVFAAWATDNRREILELIFEHKLRERNQAAALAHAQFQPNVHGYIRAALAAAGSILRWRLGIATIGDLVKTLLLAFAQAGWTTVQGITHPGATPLQDRLRDAMISRGVEQALANDFAGRYLRVDGNEITIEMPEEVLRIVGEFRQLDAALDDIRRVVSALTW
ncbi:MAG: hypothetical protein M3N47_12790 [Chloroflexota bacterium]|nr:hypothetical protein [Chloroflexota bacterium]